MQNNTKCGTCWACESKKPCVIYEWRTYKNSFTVIEKRVTEVSSQEYKHLLKDVQKANTTQKNAEISLLYPYFIDEEFEQEVKKVEQKVNEFIEKRIEELVHLQRDKEKSKKEEEKLKITAKEFEKDFGQEIDVTPLLPLNLLNNLLLTFKVRPFIYRSIDTNYVLQLICRLFSSFVERVNFRLKNFCETFPDRKNINEEDFATCILEAITKCLGRFREDKINGNFLQYFDEERLKEEAFEVARDRYGTPENVTYVAFGAVEQSDEILQNIYPIVKEIKSQLQNELDPQKILEPKWKIELLLQEKKITSTQRKVINKIMEGQKLTESESRLWRRIRPKLKAILKKN